MNQITIRPRSFNKAGFYFIGLLLVSFLGFWKSYFSKFFDGTLEYSGYFHFHAVMMLLWTVMLIAQPILIHQKKLAVHRLIGKASYVVMPVLLISVLLILNTVLKAEPVEARTFTRIIFPFRDFWFLIVFFTIAVRYKNNMHIHARAMVATGIVFIEPALARFIGNPVIIFMLGILIVLSILDRKQTSGRWIFPGMLLVYSISYAIAILEIQIPFLNSFVQWFATLPLT
jgi:hypothetical protein